MTKIIENFLPPENAVEPPEDEESLDVELDERVQEVAYPPLLDPVLVHHFLNTWLLPEEALPI